MEAITWLTHKYVMHGFLWFLHEDHHQPNYTSWFEKNDLFFVIFAIPRPAFFLIGIGVDQQKDDYVVIIASSGKGATLSLKIINYIKVGEGMFDVRPYDSNLADGNILANCKNGLQVLNYNV